EDLPGRRRRPAGLRGSRWQGRQQEQCGGGEGPGARERGAGELNMMIRPLSLIAVAIWLLASAPVLAATARPAEQVTLTTSDGCSIAADYYRPQKSDAPALILLHMLGSDRSAYREMARKLVAEGYAAIA